MANSSLPQMNPLELSDAERKVLERVGKRTKSEALSRAVSAVLAGNKPDSTDLSTLAATLPSALRVTQDAQAALVVLRNATPGSSDANVVCQAIVDGYDRIQTEIFKTGCLVVLLELVVEILFHNPTMFPDTSAAYRSTYAIYLRTLQALKSPIGAGIAAKLALAESIKRPTDVGSIALAALPTLLDCASEAEFTKETREALANLAASPRMDGSVKQLATSTLSKLPALPEPATTHA